MAGTYTPDPAFTMFNDSGAIVPSGQLETYLAGTSTPATTYSDVDLAPGHANANPVIMDSAGRATIFLTPGVSYKFIAKTSVASGGTTLWTRDNINSVPAFSQDVDVIATAGENLAAGEFCYMTSGAGGDAARTAGRWYKTDQTFSYRSSTVALVGVATAAITAGASGTVRLAGRATGFGGLAVGTLYWLDTTPGAITSTSKSSVAGRAVGKADSATTLVLFPYQVNEPIATRHTDGVNVPGIVEVGTPIGAPINFYPGTSSTGVVTGGATATVSGVLSANITPVSQAAVAENDLMTFTVPANTLAANGKMLRATMYGVNSGGGAGNRTFRVYYGTANITLAVVAVNGTEWAIDFEVVRLTATTELSRVKLFSGTGLTDFDYDATFAINTAADQPLKLTVAGAGATDGATQTCMIIEVVG